MRQNQNQYPPIRRRDRALTDEKANEILRAQDFGTLSTVDHNNQPYGIPLNYVVLNKSIYFHSAQKGHKLDNIDNNDRVCFSVVGKNHIVAEQFATNYESVVVFGRARQVQGNEKRAALEAMNEKYAPEYPREGAAIIEKEFKRTVVIKIEIEHLAGKARNE